MNSPTNRLALLFAILSFLSCNKDMDHFTDSVLSDAEVPFETKENSVISSSNDTIDEDMLHYDQKDSLFLEIPLESRLTSFLPSNDAYVEKGTVLNRSIMRLAENQRLSYMMFDLSPIDSINGIITRASLVFTVDGEAGNGIMNVFKGDSNQWRETDKNPIKFPNQELELGELIKEYTIGITETIELDATHLLPTTTTIIITHKDGNDLAMASKEHPSGIGPKLLITYTVPVDAELLDLDEDYEVIESSENVNESETDNVAPIAIADASPSSGGVPLTVKFSGGSSPDDTAITSYSWNFKDGTSSTDPNPSHTFTKVGSYIVSLTIKDAGGISSTDEVTIQVNQQPNERPTSIASATPTSGEAPLNVSFKGSNSMDDIGIAKYSWDFMDGSLSSSADGDHTFAKPGVYPVKLSVEDEQGLTHSSSISITVKAVTNAAPVAKLTATPISGAIPLKINFTGKDSSDDQGITEYQWAYGDGTFGTEINPQHTYTQAGTYEVSLTVQDEQGLKSSEKIVITAKPPVNQAPKAVASANPVNGIAPLQVSFNANSSSDDHGITSYLWDFGNNNITSTKNLNHIFDNPGVYEVKLTVTDAEGLKHSDTITITVDDLESSSNSGSSGSDSSGGSNNPGSPVPAGAVKASTFGFNASNATKAFQAAINSNNNIIVIDKQTSDWIIEPSRFNGIRNKRIIFESGVVLRAKAGAFGGQQDVLLNFHDSQDIIMEGYGAILSMNKAEYTTGEWRHALKLVKCRNISIKGLIFQNSGGDGIHISGGTAGGYSENITIEDVICRNNRRQGMSVISVQNLWVRNSEFSYTSGTMPESGVDLEGDHGTDRLININFNNCRFIGNDNAGFKIATLNMNGNSKPISVKVTDCTFTNNGLATNDHLPNAEILVGAANYHNPVKGSVLFERATFSGSQGRILFSRKVDNAFHVTFKDCTARNIIQNGSDAPIKFEPHAGASDIGGFTFQNFYIEYAKDQPFMKINGPSSLILKNISGTFTIKEPNDNAIEFNNGVDPKKGSNFNISYNHIN